MDAGFDMLPNRTEFGPALFGAMASPLNPGADEMEQARQNALFQKTVKIVGFFTRTFDLGQPTDTAEYEKLMGVILQGLHARTHAILCSDRQFVDGKDQTGRGPRWVVHLEWIEFELEVKATEPVMPGDAPRS